MACSADENKTVAVTLSSNSFGVQTMLIPGPIYSSFSTPTPLINARLLNANFTLSWIVPSTNFVLQQSSDLLSWTNILDAVTLNLTNLQFQTSLPPSNHNGFYRLAPP